MVSFTLNGKPQQFDVPDDMPLLWVIRDMAKLTGTKFGCGMAQCGACTVHLDGAPLRACITPVSAVAGKSITTIEGLNGEHPVQKALERHQAAQCGYCMSGIVMTAVALLARDQSPTEPEIRQALDKNLCRCGSHNRVVKAILDAR